MTELTHQDLDPSTIATPLLLSLCLWFTCFYLSVLTPQGKPNGFESIWISNLNCITLCVMAALSLLNIIPETIPSCWSSSFFIVDIIDCIIRRDLMWGFHGVISLVLNVCTASSPVHRGLRSASKGFFTEGSTVSAFYCLREANQWFSLLVLEQSHTCVFQTINHRVFDIHNKAIPQLLENTQNLQYLFDILRKLCNLPYRMGTNICLQYVHDPFKWTIRLSDLSHRNILFTTISLVW